MNDERTSGELAGFDDDPPARTVRRLLRRVGKATLASCFADGAPYASLVAVSTDISGRPLLLLSSLAVHTENITRNARVSLLLDGTEGFDMSADTPLTGPRVSIQGHIKKIEADSAAGRFIRRHPGAAVYADFKDFSYYEIEPELAHLVAGFGKIHRLSWPDIVLDVDTEMLQQAEEGILQHMNDDHKDAVQRYAADLLAATGGDWRMTGLDPEGFDLGSSEAGKPDRSLRLDYDRFIAKNTLAADSEDIRRLLVHLVQLARRD